MTNPYSNPEPENSDINTPHSLKETTDLQQILRVNFTFSKRQIGILLTLIGVIGLIGLTLLDSLGMGRDAEIGPMQQIGFALAILITLAGVVLIPRGNRLF